MCTGRGILSYQLCFAINGGLGDAYKGYWGWRFWGKLRGFKEKYPDSNIKAIICSHNPETAKFFRTNPYVDIVESYPAVARSPSSKKSPKDIIMDKYGKDYTFVGDCNDLFRDISYEKPQVYLANKVEEQLIDNFKNKDNGYFVVHPFAGGVIRNLPRLETYKKIIDKVTQRLGRNVVVLGGSYKRETEKEIRHATEEFDHKNPMMYNLVNKVNARTAAALCRNADGFIGTWSCFLCAILDTDVRATTYIPDHAPALISGGTYRNLKSHVKAFIIPRKTYKEPTVVGDTLAWFQQNGE